MADTTAFEKMEREGWSNPAIAKGYASGFERATGHVAQALASAAQVAEGSRVLDLCTGHGVVAAALSTRGAEVTGLDFSTAMIDLARAAVPNARFVQGDATAMTFPDQTFDAVTIGFGVPHFPDPAKGLAEAARVLRPGGRLAFSIWCGKGSEGAFGWLFDAVGRLGDPSVVLPAGPDAHMLTDPEVAHPMVRDAGFVDVETTELPTELALAAPEELYDVFHGGAVRAAVLLSGQPKENQHAIRDALAARVRNEGKHSGDGHIVPAPSVIVSALRM